MAKFGTMVAGQVLTAAELNAMGGALTSYSPTWTGITIGNGTSTGAYMQIGRMTYWRAQFILGTTSAITGAATVTLPIAAAMGYQTNRFNVGLYDSGGNEYPGSSGGVSSTTVNVQYVNAAATAAVGTNLSATLPFAWGTSDSIIVSGWYDATS